MIHFPRRARVALPALAAAAALAAVAAPAASADTHPVAWLNEQTGELSFTGTEVNDAVHVSKTWSSKAGAYVLELRIYNSAAADFSANCAEFGTYYTFWLVDLPRPEGQAAHVRRQAGARQLRQQHQPSVGGARRAGHRRPQGRRRHRRLLRRR